MYFASMTMAFRAELAAATSKAIRARDERGDGEPTRELPSNTLESRPPGEGGD